ncbi:MAG TPA: hypothetical protein VGL77_21755, partial [Armatimonadota bacterium]
GNYDHLSAYGIVSDYYEYRLLPNAKPELVAKFKKAIEKNLTFKSFYWLPQPDGTFTCPNALNCRTNALLCYPSYPGDYMAYPEFALGASRYAIIKDPLRGGGDAATFSHLANNDAWALRLLKDSLPKKDAAFTESANVGGHWTWEIYRAYNLPATAKPAPLPIDAVTGAWTLPGQFAWKRGPLYGLVFSDVVGAQGKLAGRFGGAPLDLWTRGTGSVVISFRNAKYNKVESPADLTFSCLAGELADGKFFNTGTERSQAQWITEGKVYEVRTASPDLQGDIIWRYELRDDETILSVKVQRAKKLKQAYLNLPILQREKDAVQTLDTAKGTFTFTKGASSMTLSWPSELTATLETPVKTSTSDDVRCLRIALPQEGFPLEIHIKAQ